MAGTDDGGRDPASLNPKSGWLYNCNNWPWSAAGPDSPKKADFPSYVENGTESARGLHAIRVLQDKKDFTLDSLISAAYDSYLPWFDKHASRPSEGLGRSARFEPLKAKLAEPIAALKSWDHRWAVDSVPTSLAVFWGEEIRRRPLGRPGRPIFWWRITSPRRRRRATAPIVREACDRLDERLRHLEEPWGEINRYQRLTGDIVQPFNDTKPSIPVGFTSSMWGSLASFGARPIQARRNGTAPAATASWPWSNSATRVRAKAVTAGGESGHPGSPHFNDEAQRYSTGNLRDVYFYRDQLKGHTEREYHPGS